MSLETSDLLLASESISLQTHLLLMAQQKLLLALVSSTQDVQLRVQLLQTLFVLAHEALLFALACRNLCE